MISKDEIISMAREAGFQISEFAGPMAGPIPIQRSLSDFAAIVQAHTQEQCAKVCDFLEYVPSEGLMKRYANNKDLAAAIRAMK